MFRKDMYVVGFESNVWKFLLENDNKNRKLLPRRIYYTSNNVFIYIILYSCLKQYINSYGKQTILIHGKQGLSHKCIILQSSEVFTLTQCVHDRMTVISSMWFSNEYLCTVKQYTHEIYWYVCIMFS